MMSLTKAKAVAKDPESFTTEELDDALTTIVDSDRLTEAQVTKLQAKIDPVLRARLDAAFAAPTTDCTHPQDRQSVSLESNEVHCADCGLLRDFMPWDEWAKLPTDSHLVPMPTEDGRPTAEGAS